MMGLIDTTPITCDDKIFSTAEILAAITVTSCGEQQLSHCLAAGDLTLADLYNPQSRISLNQHAHIHAAFHQCSDNPLLGLEVGKRLHLTSYGIVGFALLSSATLREALTVAAQFSLLMNFKLGLHINEEGDSARLELSDRYGLSRGQEGFWCYLEISKLITLLQDILGLGFTCQGIDLAIDATPEEQALVRQSLGLDVRFNCTRTAIRFAGQWLDAKLAQANSITHASCKATCQAQLREVIQKYDLSYQVQNLLLGSGHCIASLSDIADRLHLSPRTLRRRLDALGTSYNALLVEVRKKLAIRYLLNTPMTTEAISEQLNYSDAANFRHAFKRWTGRSPREYRVLNNGGNHASRYGHGNNTVVQPLQAPAQWAERGMAAVG
ncbi:AraC family transcriptional regulator [Pseudomonas turukhanskensis]|uniref:AraC family transcriptional regulator n=1 Tax=Pseudomonas turukhanskensis TaxID=1806536 RepID=A0A9W6K9C3_9PSED|nr:AraC family transcriptional regulator [Pseudomonas turukhanskensis]GLK91127.1 AraC family transcriptional regulator [Pseudomonas turukhanskensis]